MASPESEMTREERTARDFRTTNWEQVRAAADVETHGMFALETLCRDYWFPLYSFVRRSGHEPSRAEDLTQGFFLYLLSSGGLEHASQARGRFRSFLMGALKNYLANEWDRDQCLKRGGGKEFIWWDAIEPERRFALEPAFEGSPDALFDRQWADALLGKVMQRLRKESGPDAHTIARFERLKVFLIQPDSAPSYAEMSSELKLGEPALKSAIFRLRRRFATLIREEIARTIQDPSDLESELRHLLAAAVA
jgi:DNA-directed RNA polymerase specialized sigma24 family protein